MEGTSLYNILGVNRNASSREITKAYRKLALKYRPDKHPELKDKFMMISLANEVLSDPMKRKVYNRYGSNCINTGAYVGPSQPSGAGTSQARSAGYSRAATAGGSTQASKKNHSRTSVSSQRILINQVATEEYKNIMKRNWTIFHGETLHHLESLPMQQSWRNQKSLLENIRLDMKELMDLLPVIEDKKSRKREASHSEGILMRLMPTKERKMILKLKWSILHKEMLEYMKILPFQKNVKIQKVKLETIHGKVKDLLNLLPVIE